MHAGRDDQRFPNVDLFLDEVGVLRPRHRLVGDAEILQRRYDFQQGENGERGVANLVGRRRFDTALEAVSKGVEWSRFR